MEPDEGKEELILEYIVEAGDVVGLPYNIDLYDNAGNMTTAMFDFEIDWGDGAEDYITNADIETKSEHTYTQEGTYEIKIKGTYESLVSYAWDDTNNEGAFVENIEKLVKVKQWGITNLKNLDLSDISGLKEIVSPTKSSFKNLELVCFLGCNELTAIPDKLFANCQKIIDFSNVFERCDNLSTIGDNVFANCSSVTTFEKTFYKCWGLTTIGDNVFANCNNVISFENTFCDCEGLTAIGNNIFFGCDKVENYRLTFYRCESLTGYAIPLWLKVPDGEINDYIGIPDGYGCFYGCESLNDYEQIPGYWKESNEEA